MNKEASRKVRPVGINHVALEVGDIEEALAFYGRFLAFELRGRADGMAFIDLGDQFIAMAETDSRGEDDERHFGLVVNDKPAARKALEEAGIETMDSGFLDIRDPWGNRIQLVDYRDIQFLKDASVLESMGLGGLGKSAKAIEELKDKGILT
jgi:lactoylglutathione lyase